MQRTIVCKMSPSVEADRLLIETAERFSATCLFSYKEAIRLGIKNKLKLQYAIYHTLRKQFGLSANLTIQALRRASVSASNKRAKPSKLFRPTSISYDVRTFEWKEVDEQVSLTTIGPRIRVPVLIGDYQRKALQGKRPTSAVVVRKGKVWFVNIVIDEESPKKVTPDSVVGVDRGVRNIAVTSTGKFFPGKALLHKRERFTSRKATLQSKGTRSAKRVLRRLSKKESRFMRDVNHRVSKAIVDEARSGNAVIILEDLRYIRDRIRRFSRKLNRMVHGWAFSELEKYIRYKAELSGVPVVVVDPRNTSRTCPKCGVLDKDSRHRDTFRCVACSYESNADFVGARNIAERYIRSTRAAVMQPMVSSDLHLFAPQKQAVGF